MGPNRTGVCDLCGRHHVNISFHHLIPQTCRANAWFRKNFTREEMRTRGIHVCRECHHAIHEFIRREKDLGRHYNTREALLAHEKIANHVKWVRKRAFQRYKVK